MDTRFDSAPTRPANAAGASSTAQAGRQEKATSKKEVTCPYCHSNDTEFFSLFGQQLLTVQFYCHSCHTPFEHIKDDDVLDH